MTAEKGLLLVGMLGQVSNSDYPGINVRSSTRQQKRGFCPRQQKNQPLLAEEVGFKDNHFG